MRNLFWYRLLIGVLAALALLSSSAFADQYTETITARGKSFVACQQTGITLAAALRVDPGGLCLYNPYGSGQDAVIDWTSWDTTVVFAAVTPVWLGINNNPNAAATTGTAATVRNALVGCQTQPTCSALVAPTLPAVPVAGYLLGVGLTGAVTTTPTGFAHQRFYNGTLIVHPGCTVSFQAAAAGAASAFWSEIGWHEIPQITPY